MKRKLLNVLFIIVLVMLFFNFGEGYVEEVKAVDSRFALLWSSDIGIDNCSTIALLRDESLFDIVAGNGTYIVVINGSGAVKNVFDVRDILNLDSSVDDFRFGYLSSNLSHVFTTVVYYEPSVGIGGGGYYILVNVLFVDSSSCYSTGKVRIRSISNSNIRGDILDRKIVSAVFSPVLTMAPTLYACFGNCSKQVFSYFYQDGYKYVGVVQEDLDYINLDSGANDTCYISADVLSYVDGRQLVMASENAMGIDYVIVYPLYKDVNGTLMVDYDNCVFAGNLSFTGVVPDVAAGDMDGDGNIEVLVDNSTGIVGLTETGNTQDSSLLYPDFLITCGEVDYLITGNFTGDAKLEAIFYDPVNLELEIWSTKDRVFNLSVDGSPIRDIVLCDLDSDGYSDIFLLTTTMAYFVYNGSNWESLSLSASPTSNGLLVDINSDGYIEMIYVSDNIMYCYSTPYTGIGNKQFMDEYASRTFYVSGDTDGDGIDDRDEIYLFGTSPYMVDTDRDGVSDYDEIYIYGTSPTGEDVENSANSSNADEINIVRPVSNRAPNLLSARGLFGDSLLIALISIYSGAILNMNGRRKQIFTRPREWRDYKYY